MSTPRSSTTRGLALLLLAATALVAGCGGEETKTVTEVRTVTEPAPSAQAAEQPAAESDAGADTAGRLSREQVIERGDALCTRWYERVQERGYTDLAIDEELDAQTRAFVEENGELIDQLKALGPPAEGSEDFYEYLTAKRKINRAVRIDGDVQQFNDQAVEAAARFGFEVCGSNPDYE